MNFGFLRKRMVASEDSSPCRKRRNGKAYDCYKVTLVLTAFSRAWTGIFWYEKSTGRLVQSGEKGKANPIFRIAE